jgi:hypothetical protein
MEGEIRVTLEQEPNSFLAGAIQGDIHQVIVARDEASGRLLGMGSRSVMNAYVNGQVTRLGYLSQLRIDRSHRGRTRMLTAGYAKLRELHQDGETSFYITSIVADNRPARRILEAGLKGLPTYQMLEPFVTLALPLTRKRKRSWSGFTIDRGGPQSLSEIVDCLQRNASRFQFAPYWTREELLSPERTRSLRLEDFYLARRDGKIVGCLARWDQRSFKQAVVRGYDRRLRLLRPLINLASPWLRVPRLPPSGGELRNAFISHVAVDGDNPEVLLTLLTSAYNDSVGGTFDYLILGFAQRSLPLELVKRTFPHREYLSLLYLVYWEDGAEAAGQVDARIPHLEVATL